MSRLEANITPFDRRDEHRRALVSLGTGMPASPEVNLLDNMVILFNISSNHHVIFCNSCNFTSHQQSTRVSLSPHLLQHLLAVFLRAAALTVWGVSHCGFDPCLAND